MSYKKRGITFLEIEWKTYVERFNHLSKDEGLKRVNKQGYEQFLDMLAHVLAWWDEGMEIILAIAENREYERKKYDFAVFNAEAIAKYKDWDEKEFLNHFETSRLKYVQVLKPIDETVFDNRRVKIWINSIFIHHAREHLVTLSKFLTLDTLEYEWGTFIEKFDASEKKDEYLKTQQLTRFEDMLAHVVAWWDEGVAAVQGALHDSDFVYNGPADTDSYNAQVILKYQSMNATDVRTLFEKKRLEMIALVRGLPENAFSNSTIEDWLAADVVEHFDEHDI